MTVLTSRRAALFGLPALLLVAGTAGAALVMRVPADLDLSRAKPTAGGLYTVVVAPVVEPVALGDLHAWTVTLTDRAGRPVDEAEIQVGGGMPRHGHGLPTSPAVTDQLGPGRYLVEGLKFTMPGWGEIDLDIVGPGGSDAVTFNIVL